MTNDSKPQIAKPMAWIMIAIGVFSAYSGLVVLFKHTQPATSSALSFAVAFVLLGQGVAALVAASHPRFSKGTLLAARLGILPVLGLAIWNVVHTGAVHP